MIPASGMNRKVQIGFAAAIAALLFVVLALAIQATPAWVQQPGTPNDLTSLTDALFGPFVIPFEVLGILLTAVMIGALVTARPLTVHGDEETSMVQPNLTASETPASAAAPDEAPAPPAPTNPPIPAATAPAAPTAPSPEAQA